MFAVTVPDFGNHSVSWTDSKGKEKMINFETFKPNTDYLCAKGEGIGKKAIASLGEVTRNALNRFYKEKSDDVIQEWKEHIDKPLVYRHSFWDLSSDYSLVIVFTSGIKDSFWNCNDYKNRLKKILDFEKSIRGTSEKDAFEFKVSYKTRGLFYKDDAFSYNEIPIVDMNITSLKEVNDDKERYELSDNFNICFCSGENNIICEKKNFLQLI